MALGRLTSFTFGNSFLTLVYANSQTYYVSYAHIIAGESDSRSGDLTIWIYTAGEVGETLSVKNSDLVAIGSSATAFLALFNQNIQPYSYWQDFLDSTTASGALPSEPSALRGQCLYARFRPIYNFGSASLINVPARFKAGTLYSQVPDTGAGDFTVTRATTPTAGLSTRINKDGLIEQVANNVPRLDYPIGGAVNGCPALLVEPAATNLSLNSNSFSVETAPVATVVQNQVDIFGNPNSAWLMSGADSSTDAANANNVRKLTSGFASGSTYAGSIYIKSPTGAPVTFRYRQASVTTSTVASGDGWFRAVNVSTLSSSSYRAIFYTDGGAPIIMCHSQAELGSVPTSYIGPVGGTPIARAADVISRTSASALIGQSEGTIYAEFSVDFNNRNADILSLNTGVSDNGFFMSVRDTSVVQLIVRTAGANALIFQRTGAFSIGVNKLAMAYKNSDFAICLNGTAVQTDTSNITMPSVSINKVSLGESALYVLNQQLRIRAAELYPNRLTNAQLATLTAP